MSHPVLKQVKLLLVCFIRRTLRIIWRFMNYNYSLFIFWEILRFIWKILGKSLQKWLPTPFPFLRCQQNSSKWHALYARNLLFCFTSIHACVIILSCSSTEGASCEKRRHLFQLAFYALSITTDAGQLNRADISRR